MDALEEMATNQFHAKELTLDTISAAAQLAVDTPRRIALGIGAPKVVNEEWYARRGYIIFREDFEGYPMADDTGKIWTVHKVAMKKDISLS